MKELDVLRYREQLKVAIADPALANSKDSAGNIVTHCNIFTSRVAGWFGYTGFLDSRGNPFLASQMLRIMTTPGAPFTPLVGAERFLWAKDHAMKGRLVIASLPPPPGSIHGHVDVIAPEPTMTYSPSWGVDVPMCANVGSVHHGSTYGNPLSQAFGQEPPMLFLYVS